MNAPIDLEVGNFEVATTLNKGHDPEFWAEQATKRIVSVGSNAHPLIAQQAEAFKQSVLNCVLFYIKEAVKSDRVTLAGEFEKQGQKEMAEIIRRM